MLCEISIKASNRPGLDALEAGLVVGHDIGAELGPLVVVQGVELFTHVDVGEGDDSRELVAVVCTGAAAVW